MNITRPNVYTRITSKTSEENLIYLGMIQNYAKIGRVAPSLHAMKKVVKDYKHAISAMVGKSSNSIL
jgi:hypothetical protein